MARGAAASASLLGGVLLLPVGCGGLGPREQSRRWSEPYVAMGPRALAARPTGETQETPVSLTRTAWDCEYDQFEDNQDCNQIYEDVRAEVVEYRCEGLEPEIEVVPGEAMFTYLFRTTSFEPGECDLTVVLRDPRSGKTYEGQVPIAFADPVRLAVEHRVASDPGLHHAVLVGAAFEVLPAVYAATEFNGLDELMYEPEDFQVELEGDAFVCGCEGGSSVCAIRIPEPTSMEYQVVLRAVAAGSSTLTVRNGALERVVTLEAVEESDVVGMELYQPIGGLGLMDAEEDPLENWERVTEIHLRAAENGDIASLLALADGRRAWGGAGAYSSPSEHLFTGVWPNHACPEAPLRAQTWMALNTLHSEPTVIEAEMGSASVVFPVTVEPAE